MDDITNKVHNFADQANEDIGTKLGEIRESLNTLGATIADLVAKGSAVASSQFSTSLGTAKEKAGAWAQSGREMASQTLDKAKEKEADLEEVIQLHPLAAVVAGIGIGFFLGAITMKSNNS